MRRTRFAGLAKAFGAAKRAVRGKLAGSGSNRGWLMTHPERLDKEIITALEREDELTRQHGEKVHALIPLNLDGYIFGDAWDEHPGEELASSPRGQGSAKRQLLSISRSTGRLRPQRAASAGNVNVYARWLRTPAPASFCRRRYARRGKRKRVQKRGLARLFLLAGWKTTGTSDGAGGCEPSTLSPSPFLDFRAVQAPL